MYLTRLRYVVVPAGETRRIGRRRRAPYGEPHSQPYSLHAIVNSSS